VRRDPFAPYSTRKPWTTKVCPTHGRRIGLLPAFDLDVCNYPVYRGSEKFGYRVVGCGRRFVRVKRTRVA
jgi:hypothetical protein